MFVPFYTCMIGSVELLPVLLSEDTLKYEIVLFVVFFFRILNFVLNVVTCI